MTFGLGPAAAAADAKLRSFVRGANVRYVSLLDRFCNAEGCLIFAPPLNGVLTTSDSGHLTTPAAIFAAQGIKDAGLMR